MKVEYNRQGAARKELVQAISAITGEKAKYLFLPTKAYRIGSIMVWKNGAMECEDGELFQKVVKELEARGFKPEETAAEQAATEETPEQEPVKETAEPDANPEPELSQETAELEEGTEPETAKEHEVPNEKYAFRCFLLRLGFIGKEYKDCRKILLEKLSGSAAFRNGGKKDAVSQ